MNTPLKERVDSNRIKFTFILAVFLSLFIGKTFAQDNQQPFDYTRTIWIIHSVNGKGIVYGLPDYYEPKSAFILVRNILTRYVYGLEDFPSSTSVQDLAPEYVLILMNDVTEQSLLIGNHWISDGKKIALMQEADFNRLKAILDHRVKTDQPPHSKHPTDSLISSFRKKIKDYPEESEYRLKPYEEGKSRQSLETTNNSSLASTSQAAAISSSASASSVLVKTAAAKTSQNEANSSPNLAAPEPIEIESTVNKENKENKNKSYFFMGIAGLLLVVFGIWRLKRKQH
jgi:hypothetical protein